MGGILPPPSPGPQKPLKTTTGMKLWVKIFAGVVSGAGILLLSVLLLLLLRCRRNRQLTSKPTTQFTETGSKYTNDSFQSALAKLHVSYKSSSSRSSLRFHHLHHSQQQPIAHHRPTFNWDDHPHLIAEAVEDGWSRFVFKTLLPTASAARSTPLLGLCASCDTRREPAEFEWEVPHGSSEFMQTVRLNPATKRSGSNSNPHQHGDDSSSNRARMSLPLPGPRLGGSSFPQEAYFEITILYLQPLKHRSLKPGRRAKEDEGDRTKLMQENPIEAQSAALVQNTTNQDSKLAKEEEGKQNNHVISLGLTMGGSPPISSTPGTYPGSIGFNSNGSVYLDGLKLVFESERAEWAGVNRVIGCGFDPSKKKVFLTVDSELVHVIRCNSEVYKSPLYPVLAVAKADVMVLVNMGQRAFKYAPANAHRTANPCFVRSPANDGGASVVGLVDSRELFSMGRIDSELHLVTPKANSDNSNKNNGNIDSITVDIDGESDLFEIALQS